MSEFTTIITLTNPLAVKSTLFLDFYRYLPDGFTNSEIYTIIMLDLSHELTNAVNTEPFLLTYKVADLNGVPVQMLLQSDQELELRDFISMLSFKDSVFGRALFKKASYEEVLAQLFEKLSQSNPNVEQIPRIDIAPRASDEDFIESDEIEPQEAVQQDVESDSTEPQHVDVITQLDQALDNQLKTPILYKQYGARTIKSITFGEALEDFKLDWSTHPELENATVIAVDDCIVLRKITMSQMFSTFSYIVDRRVHMYSADLLSIQSNLESSLEPHDIEALTIDQRLHYQPLLYPTHFTLLPASRVYSNQFRAIISNMLQAVKTMNEQFPDMDFKPFIANVNRAPVKVVGNDMLNFYY